MKRSTPIEDIFFLKSEGIYYRIGINEIKWAVTKGNYCTLFLDKDKSYDFRSSLTILLSALSPLSNSFIQTHRNFMINSYKIDFYDPNGTVMIDGEEIPVSKNFKKEFEEKILILKM